MIEFKFKVKTKDLIYLKRIIKDNNFFKKEEQKIAISLIKEYLLKDKKSGYNFIIGTYNNKIVAYTCYGKIPCTKNSYDLYWIVVDKKFRRYGFGTKILNETEKKIKQIKGKSLYIETSSKKVYLNTRNFYLKNSYKIACILKDFYNSKDHKYIFVKKI
jgi:ribosomal protein S18 acetylase RimI-like enzyme